MTNNTVLEKTRYFEKLNRAIKNNLILTSKDLSFDFSSDLLHFIHVVTNSSLVVKPLENDFTATEIAEESLPPCRRISLHSTYFF